MKKSLTLSREEISNVLVALEMYKGNLCNYINPAYAREYPEEYADAAAQFLKVDNLIKKFKQTS